jgi:NAD(P)-dependent dehydrogenase (short-subunit alcohol dehydrogenase family)
MNPERIVLVTGASSGFGRLTAETLARVGYRVFAGLRASAGRNAAAAAELRAFAEPVELDVTDDASVERAVAHVVAAAGGVDVVVNNAGLGAMGVSEGFTVEQVRQLFDVNVLGPVRVNRAVLPHMRRRGAGLLVHVGSQLGRLAMPFYGVYGATKWALEGIADALRLELGPVGIDSVIVEPGAYPTNLAAHGLAPADAERVLEYGATAAIPQHMGAALAQMFAAPDAPKPQAVADAIRKLVETPFGQRPLRTVVGGDTAPFEALNALTEQSQRQMLAAFGLDEALAQRAAN